MEKFLYLITLRSNELCIFSIMLLTVNSAGLYTWFIKFLSILGKSRIIHTSPFLLVILYALLQAWPLVVLPARSASNNYYILPSMLLSYGSLGTYAFLSYSSYCFVCVLYCCYFTLCCSGHQQEFILRPERLGAWGARDTNRES